MYVGCSVGIVEGKIGLALSSELVRLLPGGDLVVLATGFVTQEVLVGKLLGEDVAKKVGPIWGVGEDGEMNNMWKRTAQTGLWFVGGSFTNCRTYSRYVALQIKAIEQGLLPR